MNKIKITISLFFLSAGGALLAQTNAGEKTIAETSESACVRKCTSSEPEVTILNRRNRYAGKGAMQRRIYPRFMYSSIKPVKTVCDCTVCHPDTAAEKQTSTKKEIVATPKEPTKEELRRKKQLYPKHIRTR